jgi:N-methylhydantoinase A
MSVQIGADVGGTFTDVVLIDDAGKIWMHKVLSSPPDPLRGPAHGFQQAVLDATAHLLAATQTPGSAVSRVAHGTTVATNAVLEHRGARTALLTTKGFRDVLELRRIRAPQMYDLFWVKPAPLVERYLRLEVDERMAADGSVLKEPDESNLQEIRNQLEREGVESVAVCLLHSYAYPRHEARVGEYLQFHLPGVPISLSHEVLPERLEYERTATTVVNAYVRPIMSGYLHALRGGLGAQGIHAPLLLMQSAGGLTPEQDAEIRPVYVLESGPAAGVLAAASVAQKVGAPNVITLDVGGTTAKASLIEQGHIAYSPEYEVGAGLSAGNRLVGGGGDRIRAPSIDIAEVGSGGGSIAALDRAGGLRVGPRSAGALPGPACYGRGGVEPTVTDANVVLGYIRAGKLANGDVTIDAAAAERAIHDTIAAPLGMDLLRAAEGIHRIANARTMRALRAVSTERGRDPRDFVLMGFGGSGPVHAAGLARELGSPRVIIPPLPGLFSAFGLLVSGVEHHAVRSCLLSGDALTPRALWEIRDALQQQLLAQFRREGFDAEQLTLTCSADVRFVGQASEIRLLLDSVTGARAQEWVDAPYSENTLRALYAAFLSEHERLYGHRSEKDNLMQVIALRVVGKAQTGQPDLNVHTPADTAPAVARTRRAYFGERVGIVETPVLSRSALTGTVRGPLLIDEYDSTTVVPPGAMVRRDEFGNLLMEF